jgi:hypothetical protein
MPSTNIAWRTFTIRFPKDNGNEEKTDKIRIQRIPVLV